MNITINTQRVQYVYTDGSCLRNGSKYAKAGIGIFFGEDDKRNVSKKIISDIKLTNNIAELLALKTALTMIAQSRQNIHWCVITDSKYSINCIEKWVVTWEKNGWRTSKNKEVKNKELIQSVYNLYENCKHKIKLMHIKAHTSNQDMHSKGNKQADLLAVMSANSTKKTNEFVIF